MPPATAHTATRVTAFLMTVSQARKYFLRRRALMRLKWRRCFCESLPATKSSFRHSPLSRQSMRSFSAGLARFLSISGPILSTSTSGWWPRTSVHVPRPSSWCTTVVLHATSLSSSALSLEHGIPIVEDNAQRALRQVPWPTPRHLWSAGGAQLSRNEEHLLRRRRSTHLHDPALVTRAEILREKGTDRSRFFRGEVDRYTWVDIGSSFLRLTSWRRFCSHSSKPARRSR